MHRTLCIKLIVTFAVCLAIGGSVAQAETWTVTKNPYAGVDWQAVERHRGNFHTHTTESDGRHDPEAVVDHYHEMGYDVLALTDHDHVTWPWPAFDRSPSALDMIAVPGNELSHHQHTLSLFTTYPFAVRDHHLESQTQAIHEVHDLGGLTVLAHPGRYWELEDDEVPQQVVEKYVSLFKRFPSLIGHEVVNQTDRYPEDRALWDALLTELMPARPVWGMANDDSHSRPHVGLNSTILLLDASNRKAVRRALTSGRYFFNTRAMHPASQRDRDTTPKIKRVRVADGGTRITVDVTSGGKPIDQANGKWISANGQVVHRGTTLDLSTVDGLDKYVRFQVRGQGGVTFTQPFGIGREP